MIDNLKHAMQKIVEFMTQSEVLQLQTDDGEKESPEVEGFVFRCVSTSRSHKITDSQTHSQTLSLV